MRRRVALRIFVCFFGTATQDPEAALVARELESSVSSSSTCAIENQFNSGTMHLTASATLCRIPRRLKRSPTTACTAANDDTQQRHMKATCCGPSAREGGSNQRQQRATMQLCTSAKHASPSDRFCEAVASAPATHPALTPSIAAILWLSCKQAADMKEGNAGMSLCFTLAQKSCARDCVSNDCRRGDAPVQSAATTVLSLPATAHILLSACSCVKLQQRAAAHANHPCDVAYCLRVQLLLPLQFLRTSPELHVHRT